VSETPLLKQEVWLEAPGWQLSRKASPFFSYHTSRGTRDTASGQECAVNFSDTNAGAANAAIRTNIRAAAIRIFHLHTYVAAGRTIGCTPRKIKIGALRADSD
jgi:hypothetical protein